MFKKKKKAELKMGNVKNYTPEEARDLATSMIILLSERFSVMHPVKLSALVGYVSSVMLEASDIDEPNIKGYRDNCYYILCAILLR